MFTLPLLFFLVLINAVGLVLAFWVYWADKKEKINKFFALVTIAILLWLNLGYVYNLISDINIVLILVRITFGAICLLFIPGYFFSIYFPKRRERNKILDFLVIAVIVIFILLSIFTDLVIKTVEPKEWGIDFTYGELGMPFLFTIIVLTFLIAVQIFKKSFKVSEEEKLKIRYFLIGWSIWVLMNLIFNVALPAIRGTIQYYQFGNYSAIFFLGFTAYAIVRRELFGIKIVLTALFVGLIALLLFLDLLIFTEERWIQIVKGGVLVMFLFFGWFLIKSVLREIKQREALAQAYIKLQQLDKAKTEFLSIASHQLRTPLTAIKGYISMMLEEVYGKLPESVAKPLENIYNSNERLIKLVNDLLNISRIEAGRVEMDMKNLSLQEITKELIEELKPMAEKKNLYLKLKEPSESLPKTSLDKGKIRQVIMNIIDNAIKYTEKGGITVSLNQTDSKLQVSVSDTGDGLSQEELDHLFTSFTRGKAGTRLWVEGAGLGMYIAKKFLELHNGKVWAESEGKGKGSTFYIELPIKTAEETLIQNL